MQEKYSFWRCFRVMVRVVGGWHIAILCFPLVWSAAKGLQREMEEYHQKYKLPPVRHS